MSGACAAPVGEEEKEASDEARKTNEEEGVPAAAEEPARE
jgi:hypothetical protein